MNQENTYLTSDMGEAAGLTAAGFQITRLIPAGINRMEFCFQLETEDMYNDLLKARELYWKNELMVSAQLMQSCIRILKARLHNERV